MLPYGLAVSSDGLTYLVGEFARTVTFGGAPGSPSLTDDCGRGGSGFLVRAMSDGSATWARAAQGCSIDHGLVEIWSDRVIWVQTHDGSITFDGGANPPIGFPQRGIRNASLASYSSAGDLLWAADVGGDGVNEPLDLAIGPDGSTYLVGKYTSPIVFGPGAEEVVLPYEPPEQAATGYRDGYVAKWNPDGSLGWAASFTGDGSQIPEGVAVTEDGTIVVVGDFAIEMDVTAPSGSVTTMTPSPLRVGFVLGFDALGEIVWSQRWGNTTSGADHAEDADVSGGLALAVGYADDDASFGPNWPTPSPIDGADFRASWSSNGSVERVIALPSRLARWEIDADADGRLAIGGIVLGPMSFGSGRDRVDLDPQGFGDPGVATFAPDGSEECLWPILSDREDFYDRAAGIALDGAGGVWATGYFTNHLTFVPGTPEEVTLTAEGGDATTWLAHFQLSRP